MLLTIHPGEQLSAARLRVLTGNDRALLALLIVLVEGDEPRLFVPWQREGAEQISDLRFQGLFQNGMLWAGVALGARIAGIVGAVQRLATLGDMERRGTPRSPAIATAEQPTAKDMRARVAGHRLWVRAMALAYRLRLRPQVMRDHRLMFAGNPALLTIGKFAQVETVGEQSLDGILAERIAAPGAHRAIPNCIEFLGDFTGGVALGAPSEQLHQSRMVRRLTGHPIRPNQRQGAGVGDGNSMTLFAPTHDPKGQNAIVQPGALAALFALLRLFGEVIGVPLGNSDEDSDIEPTGGGGGVYPVLHGDEDDPMLIQGFQHGGDQSNVAA